MICQSDFLAHGKHYDILLFVVSINRYISFISYSWLKLLNNKITFLILIFLVLIHVSGMGWAVDVPGGDNAGNVLVTDGKYIDEPVFGGSLYYYETGPKTGEPVVLVHGLGEEGMSYWRYVVDMLAPTYRVILLDLPGFGRSGREKALYSPEQYAKLLDWFIHQRTNLPVTLIGHSMGGAISLFYASVHPEKLKRLIVLDAAGILHRAAFTKHFIEIADLGNPTLDGVSRKSTSRFNEWLSNMLVKAESIFKPLERSQAYPLLSERILNRFSPTVVAGYALAQTDFSRVINKIRTHTTIIWGREDDTSPPRVADVLNKRIPGSQLIWIEKAGHNPIVENIDAINQVLKEVLQTPVGQKISHAHKPVRIVKRDRKGSCTDKNGIRFSGYYSELRIIECGGVRLNNVTTPSLYISESEVNVIGGYFKSDDTAITVHQSILKMTNATVEGKVAIKASNSKLDLAGVDITAKQVGVEAGEPTVLICSLCEFNVPAVQGSVHGLYKLHSDYHL